LNLNEEKEYQDRVKKRVLILRDMMKEGKIIFSEDMKDGMLEESLLKVRYDKNGEPDLSTVNGLVRSLALSAEGMHHRERMKSVISLHEIQRRYFNMISSNFQKFYDLMLQYKSTPHQLAHAMAYGKKDVDYIDNPIKELLKDIEDFWELLAESAYLHLQDDYDSIKAVFGGDLFPSNDDNIASKCGVYTDTIILPCPFIRSRFLFDRWNKQQRVYYLLKHGLNVLQYKELALTELDKPIVAILPDKEMMEGFTAIDQVMKLGDIDTLYHAKKVFGRDFESIEDLLSFGQELNTIDKVLNEIENPEKVLFDTEFKEPLRIQLEKQLDGQSSQLMGTKHPGLIVSMLGAGRMNICNEILMKSSIIGGVPLIDAPTSWEYFKWKLQYDSERTHPNRDFSKLHVVHGINGLENTKLNWVGKIPPKGLIELRKTGAISEIREILSKGIDELVSANEFDFTETSHKVFNNLNSAFNQHQENIKKLISKKWKIAGADFGSWIVVGTVEIASACLGTPLFGATAFTANQFLDAPKIKDLPKTIEKMKEVNNEKKSMKKSPLGLIFNYKK
jgi:hypothetical protein